jgi:hypothetical protein
MVDAIIAGAVVLAVIVGLWLTRNSKAAGRLPGMVGRDGILDAQLERYEHGEAFGEDRPREH